MTHREFLSWLRPRLEDAARTGLAPDGVRAIRDQLEAMRGAGPLQPFASRLLRLATSTAVLDGEIVAGLAAQLHAELAPARERTVVASALSADDDE
jgi:hypothetical protein